MNLLPEEDLIPTSRVDHADWNYRPFLAYAARRRFALILSLLPHDRVSSLLEVGFGSGVFMPELAKRTENLHGIDVHTHVSEVQDRLARRGVQAKLFCEDAAHTSFPDHSFDIIVTVSALEFIRDIGEAAREFARLLKPNGRLLAVMPEDSPLLDLALRFFTGESAQRDYGDRRQSVIPAMTRYLQVTRTKRYPPIYAAYEFAAANMPFAK